MCVYDDQDDEDHYGNKKNKTNKKVEIKIIIIAIK